MNEKDYSVLITIVFKLVWLETFNIMIGATSLAISHTRSEDRIYRHRFIFSSFIYFLVLPLYSPSFFLNGIFRLRNTVSPLSVIL